MYKSFLTQGEGNEKGEVSVFQADDPTIRTLAGVQNFAANLRLFSDKGFHTTYDSDMPALATVEPGNATLLDVMKMDGTSYTIAFATKLAECGNGGSRYAADPTSPWAAFMGQNAARKPAVSADPRATFLLQPQPGECFTSPLMAQSTGPLVHVAMLDASVRAVSPAIHPMTWNAAMQPNDGMPLGGSPEPDD